MNQLSKIEDEVVSCTKCKLHSTRTNAVPGKGSQNAKIMFIGEGPGKNEDLKGEPFVGAAGKLLDELLAIIDLKRDDVFITNVVKCRPPGNRDPEMNEVKTCWPYLEEQIKALKPKLIVTLGRHAMNRFLPDLKISKEHGQPKRYKGLNNSEQVFLPLYHPAVALYNGNYKQILIDDIMKIPKILSQIEDDS